MESREDAEEEDTPRTVNDTTADTTSTPDTTADTTSTPDTTADTTSTPDTTNTSTPDTTNTSTPNTTADTTSTPDTTNTSTPNTTADTTSTGSTVNTATDTGTAAAGGALPTSAGHTDEETVELQRQEIPVEEEPSAGAAEGAVELLSDQTPRTPAAERPAPPSNLAFSRPTKKKVLVAPALSLSLGRSESTVSEDFPPAFLSPDDDDTGPDFDLDAMETPSDSESLHFPVYELDLEDDLRRLGVATRRRAESRSGPRSRFEFDSGSAAGGQAGPGALEREDVVDHQGTRWRCFSTGGQESRVNMSVLQPYLRVLSHGGYYGDGMNDIIVFASCYLPQNSLHNYQQVMDHLFRYVVGTLDLMVSENYVMVYLCAGGQKEKLPGISWLRECYTTINRRLRKNLKGFFVVHPTWYIKALATIIRPFISSKFSRKLQFVESLEELSLLLPTEHAQIPKVVTE
ncbi:bcl-2/adenovirus E1B 19 kDa-interacting protein 2-like protein isoform X2 [Eleginops maclovinus]|uniref:bcl-2/adenovirus E1B 19 kDa-interacting protein 2-like protein isoform X2 n=1 Tax=Eleginops maclovinus TaxID=56733 RepID=UPI0030803C32